MRMDHPKILLFDWDNTLVDTRFAVEQSFKDTVQILGIDLNNHGFQEYHRHLSAKDIFSLICKEKMQEACNLYLEFYLKHREKKLEILIHSEKTLEYLLEKGIKIAVISNKRGKLVREEIEMMKWQNYFFNVVGAGDAQEDKPSPLAIKHLLKNIDDGINNKNIWLVGDSPVDIKCAYNANIISVLIGKEEIDITPHYKVKDHLELQTLLKKF